MAELGRAALVVTLGLCLYAAVAGAYAAARRRRRLAQSARNALIAAFGSTVVAAGVLAAGFLRSDFSLTYVAEHSNRSLGGPYKLSAFWGGQEGSLLLWLLILTGYAALAVWVNRNRTRDLVVWVTPVLGSDRGRLLVPPRRRGEPVRDAGRAARRRRAQPEPPEPVHDGPPAVPLPRLRRPRGAVRIRDGSAALGPHRRALDRRDAPLDADRLDRPRRRPAARIALGLRRGRLGRLLRVGSGRERRSDAVPRRDRVPPLGDDPGEARDAEGLERRPRRARVLPLALRHVPHALRAS